MASSYIVGNIGTSPIKSSAITGFALVPDASGTFCKSFSMMKARADHVRSDFVTGIRSDHRS